MAQKNETLLAIHFSDAPPKKEINGFMAAGWVEREGLTEHRDHEVMALPHAPEDNAISRARIRIGQPSMQAQVTRFSCPPYIIRGECSIPNALHSSVPRAE